MSLYKNIPVNEGEIAKLKYDHSATSTGLMALSKEHQLLLASEKRDIRKKETSDKVCLLMKEHSIKTTLAVQWLGICLPVQMIGFYPWSGN